MCMTRKPTNNMSRPAVRPMSVTMPNSWPVAARCKVLEGAARARNVVIEFSSMDDAQACYNSPEYAKARGFRQKASDGEIVLVEGV